ncbi:hypothetical protein CCAX7_36060 [Capsulimonas corticalis]|uniref:Uncharacterized protein n=1 Tax=Capsulimonas corticalis TaxID=2219043 RepID=A0A402D772_9BACT|nr:HD domain-containing phosphohydrolase [Capsulimonas corticalis]BDI31555.1 hypothetical protein CCAX7_36060 [Capsulimonas corticalis]
MSQQTSRFSEPKEGSHLGPLKTEDQLFPERLNFLNKDCARLPRDQFEGTRPNDQMRARLRATAVLQNAFVLTDPNLPDHPIVYANAAFLELTGYSSEEVIGFNCRFLQGPKTDLVEVGKLRQAIQEERSIQTTLLNYRKDGSTFWNELTIAPVRDEAGTLTNFVAVQTDVTRHKAVEEALRANERRLGLALMCGQFGTWSYHESVGHTQAPSDQMKALLGLPPDAPLSSEAFFAAVHPDDLERLLSAGNEALATRQTTHVEFRVVCPNGNIRWLENHISVDDLEIDGIRGLFGVAQDITERKNQEAEREAALMRALEQADHDPLTELWNHRAFHRMFQNKIENLPSKGATLTVAILDLDNFKFFNTAYGHAVGDEVLRKIAQRLLEFCGPEHIAARFGGDEFAVLFSSAHEPEAQSLAERLRSHLAGMTYQVCMQEIAIPLTLSIGMALINDINQDRHEALRLADERLRRAKTGGDTDSQADQLRQLILGTVQGFSMVDALVTAVDNKDRYTCKHSEDVMTYSLMIAREFGLAEDELHTIAIAALLHDVGKIGVPDAVLRKPGRLTEEEFAAIKQHPMMGVAIVGAVPELSATMDAVRHHHERWDGAGYPSGLVGVNIPLIARIMAVADAFSAMTTDRPYRKGMAPQKAIAILSEGAGSQWDARCVFAFIRAQRNGDVGSTTQ